MDLRHDDLPPLTSDQQAETLRLAARLQAEHQAQASSEALMRVAAEAGIDPRFVREAAHRVAWGRSTRKRGKEAPRPLVATLLLATANALALFWQPFNSVDIDLPTGAIATLVGTAFLLAIWVAQERRVRWTTPIAVVAVWSALALPLAAWHLVHEGGVPTWIAVLATIVGVPQLVAALFGALVGGYRPQLVPVDRPQSPLG